MDTILKCIIVLIISAMCFAANAQNVKGDTVRIIEELPDDGVMMDEDPPAMFVEEMPEFPGGQDSLNAFLSREIVYPKVALENGIKGTVLVEFVVEKDGRVTNGKVKVPLFPDCDEEALRGVMSMPNWRPGKNMGKPVRCFYQVPITFRP
jgi:protein TonB